MCVNTPVLSIIFLSSSHNADCLLFKSGCFLHLGVLRSCVSGCWELADLLIWVLSTPAILTTLLLVFLLVYIHTNLNIFMTNLCFHGWV